MKKILKTIACCLGALAIAFTAFFVPTIKKSASADVIPAVVTTPPNGLTWTSDNIQIAHTPCYSEYASLNSPLSYDYALNIYSFKLVVSSVSLSGYNIDLYANIYFDFDKSYSSNIFMNSSDFHVNTTGYFNVIKLKDHNNTYTKLAYLIIPGDNGATFNMKSLELGYGKSFFQNVSNDYFGFPSLIGSPEYDNYMIYSYTDTSNWKYIFAFPSSVTLNDNNSIKYNIFYSLASVDFSDNQIYQEGYDEGYNRGLALGTTEGYGNGYDTGYDVGFGNGRNEGIQNANNYSFLGLFGAIVDAPLTGLRSLFNFEFLGINLLSFITSLLTIALITFVIKKLMGR